MSAATFKNTFGKFIVYANRLIEEDRDESPMERRNWRYDSLKNIKEYNSEVYDLLTAEHKRKIEDLEKNLDGIKKYKNLFDEIIRELTAK